MLRRTYQETCNTCTHCELEANEGTESQKGSRGEDEGKGKEGRKEGRKEGWKEGRMEGRKEGRKEEKGVRG